MSNQKPQEKSKPETAHPVISILGEENAQKIRDKITDIVLNSLEEEMPSMAQFYDDLHDWISEVIEDVKEEVLDDFKQRLKSNMESMAGLNPADTKKTPKAK